MKIRAMVAGVALLMAAVVAPAAEPASSPDDGEIWKVDEEFRRAKVKNDTEALGQLVADEYYGINQGGIARNKEQLLELFKTFKIRSLAVDIQRIKSRGDNAVVAGRQREVLDCGRADCPAEVMLFLRTYVRRGGRWLLLSNAQMIDQAADNPYPHDKW